MLAQEPWCFTPDQIGKLTDLQIERLYARPAIERSKKHSPSGPQRTAPSESTGPPGEPGSREHRSACISAYMNIQGLKRERAEAQYDRQLAQYEAEKATNAKQRRP